MFKYFLIPATILSTALFFIFVYGGIQKENFMRISFGWTSRKDPISWILMWWNVWGIMLPLAVYSLKTIIKNSNKKIHKTAKYFYGFFAVFIIANIITFQPTAWDNTKLFAYVYLGFSLLAAHVAMELWKNKKTKLQKILRKVGAILLIIMLSTTGILELIRLQRFDKNTYKVSDTEDIKFAQQVMENTKTDAIFLTASDHNHPLLMWGSRQVVLGYKGWVTNFGFDTGEKSKDVASIYQNPTQSLHLLKKYNVDYVVIGEAEKREFSINQEHFDENFPIKFRDSKTTIYSLIK